ncbi:Transcription factor CPC [Sesamum angolense]|uniref:Transcription factor CPC n=1 Tax=Sesamum angolense TaxID=2727404 RepID=A0AAE2BUH7_9LAMI|nr:Transcription factor CPC [Sesamum angolense]
MADDLFQKPFAANEAAVVGSTGVAAAENPISQESKQPEFSGDEETLIIRMYNLVGERWSLIAGRIPGRSADEIEKYWNSRHSTSQ